MEIFLAFVVIMVVLGIIITSRKEEIERQDIRHKNQIRDSEQAYNEYRDLLRKEERKTKRLQSENRRLKKQLSELKK